MNLGDLKITKNRGDLVATLKVNGGEIEKRFSPESFSSRPLRINNPLKTIWVTMVNILIWLLNGILSPEITEVKKISYISLGELRLQDLKKILTITTRDFIAPGHPYQYSLATFTSEGQPWWKSQYLIEHSRDIDNPEVLHIWLLPSDAMVIFNESAQFVEILPSDEIVVHIREGKRE